MSGRLGETPISDETIEQVRLLHAEVDALAADLVHRLPGKLVCRRGCCECCVDDLTVFPVEAAVIRAGGQELLASAEPHAPAACAFLDENGSCRIYPWRPYVCRTQGLPLRWLEDSPAGEVQELRDICPLNDDAFTAAETSLEELPIESCWTLGTFEGRLAGLQASLTGLDTELPRISLRSLFKRRP